MLTIGELKEKYKGE